MATRAVIQIEEIDFARLYKHWDGYPEGTLAWLEVFNSDFAKNRGDDASYKFAQLVRSSVSLANEYELDTSNYTGWGIIPGNEECGAEYLYTLYKDGTVGTKEV